MELTKKKHVKVKQIGDVVVLTPNHELTGGDETDDLQELILELDAQGNGSLLINVKKVEWMSTMGLTVLIQGHKRYAERKARMKLCTLSERLLSLIILTKLVMVFDIYDTEEEAIASFAEAQGDVESNSTDSNMATA